MTYRLNPKTEAGADWRRFIRWDMGEAYETDKRIL